MIAADKFAVSDLFKNQARVNLCDDSQASPWLPCYLILGSAENPAYLSGPFRGDRRPTKNMKKMKKKKKKKKEC